MPALISTPRAAAQEKQVPAGHNYRVPPVFRNAIFIAKYIAAAHAAAG